MQAVLQSVIFFAACLVRDFRIRTGLGGCILESEEFR